MIEKKEVLAIIVTYNSMKWIKRCIDSLINSSIPIDIMVIDNLSKDKTQEYIKENYPQVIFIQSEENLGFGKANNIGMQYAIDNNYDYVYLLNHDAWVEKETINGLITINKNNPQYGILSPFQCQANMSHLDLNFVGDICSWKSNKMIFNDLYFGNIKDVYEVPRVMAAHWLISRACLLEVGGFSPSFPHYGEDYNYCDRVYYHGLNIGICPSLRAIHDREFRIESKKKMKYLYGYIKIIMVISNINNRSNIFMDIIHSLLILLLKYKTLPSLNLVFKLIISLKTIMKYKKKSCIKCAFLNYEEQEKINK